MIYPLSPMSSVSQYMPLSEKTDGPLVRKKGGQQGTGDKGERNMSGTGFTVATIIAIVIGPIAAVLITRFFDVHRAKKDRRWDIFRNLMRYRRTALHAEFVGALNLLEVEFHHDPAVIDAWKRLLESFETPGQENRRSTALTRLLSEVAKSLGAPIEQLDIFSGAYSPQGWFDADEQNADIRAYLHDIATGKKALPMIAFSPPEGQALPEP